MRGAIVSVHMYSHTIVYFYKRTSENLVNVGSSRHKLPRHLQFCVGDTDPSGQNWSDTSCLGRHVATCRRHFQLSPRQDGGIHLQQGGGSLLPSGNFETSRFYRRLPDATAGRSFSSVGIMELPPPLGILQVPRRRLINVDEFGAAFERCNRTG